VNEPANFALPGGGEDILGALDVAGGHLLSVGPASDATATVIKNLDVTSGESKRIGFEEIPLYSFDGNAFQQRQRTGGSVESTDMMTVFN